MKKTLLILLVYFSMAAGSAQGLSNFFSQKEADVKYLLAQIAALKVYIGDAEKGYSVARQGLTHIGSLKKTEFDLHSTYFNSLKMVNPSIAKNPKLTDIITCQSAIINDFRTAIQRIRQYGNFSEGELSYLTTVYSKITDECSKSLSVLIEVATDEIFEMTDNQRIKLINGIDQDMRDKYIFSQSFTGEALLLAAERENELREIDFLKQLN